MTVAAAGLAWWVDRWVVKAYTYVHVIHTYIRR